MNGRGIPFKEINRALLAEIDKHLKEWLPDGYWIGDEYVARNPTRADRHAGSFKIRRDGIWADFATGDSGRDLIDLVAYLNRVDLKTAALDLGRRLGVLRA